MRRADLTAASRWSYIQSPLPPLSAPQAIYDALADEVGDAPDDLLGSSESTWRSCGEHGPREVHLHLLQEGRIPDPRVAMNEKACQWVGERDWVYRCTFRTTDSNEVKVPAKAAQAPQGSGQEAHDLVFEGLDTFAHVWVNGEKVLETDNQFQTYRAPIGHLLRAQTRKGKGKERENELLIIFQSAFMRGRQREISALGEGKHLAAWNGDPSRLFVRKAGFQYGWDWGPTLLTCGPYRPILLESYSARIVDFFPETKVDEALNAWVKVHLRSERAGAGAGAGAGEANHRQLEVLLVLRSTDGKMLAETKMALEGNQLRAQLLQVETEKLQLWWPRGLGEQKLYDVTATVIDAKTGLVVDEVTKRVGFRRCELIEEPVDGEEGKSFYFQINDVPVFCAGVNWIPIDSFVTRPENDKKMRHLLQLASDAGFNMVRVWGGGVYEPSAFYETCDELGLMVWQDFMFACGLYPAKEKGFEESVRKEAEDQVKRMRHHPSIIFWAGNNEDYQVAESEGHYSDPSDAVSKHFPARSIYEQVLPDALEEFAPQALYRAGSPWSAEGLSSNSKTGDLHQWNVWHGVQEPYQNYDKLAGRLVSEFGMEAFPDIKTTLFYLKGTEGEDFPQSAIVTFHNKAAGNERRLASYLAENIRFDAGSLEGFTYATQFLQAEALRTAYSSWKRNNRGEGKRATMGALVWQLNDVWPVTSWSIVDCFCRPKPAYYVLKRELSPLSLGMKRFTATKTVSPLSAEELVEEHVDIWGYNATLSYPTVLVTMSVFELKTGKEVRTVRRIITLRANESTEIYRLSLGEPSADTPVVVACWTDQEGGATVTAWPEPYKHLHSARTGRDALDMSRDGGQLRLSSLVPVKGIILSATSEKSMLDNYFDVVPGRPVLVDVSAFEQDTSFTARHLFGEARLSPPHPLATAA